MCRAEAALQLLSPTHAFNVLHLRAEEDWVQHCARWEHKQDGEGQGLPFRNGQQQAATTRTRPKPSARLLLACAGLVRDNCLNNTEAVGDSLALHGIDAQASSRCFAAGHADLLHWLPGSFCSCPAAKPVTGPEMEPPRADIAADGSSFKGSLLFHLLPHFCAGATAGPDRLDACQSQLDAASLEQPESQRVRLRHTYPLAVKLLAHQMAALLQRSG